jgi:hypothetical protein
MEERDTIDNELFIGRHRLLCFMLSEEDDQIYLSGIRFVRTVIEPIRPSIAVQRLPPFQVVDLRPLIFDPESIAFDGNRLPVIGAIVHVEKWILFLFVDNGLDV